MEPDSQNQNHSISSSLPSESNEQKIYQIILVENKEKFSCAYPGCGRVFNFKSEVKRHYEVHSDYRPHKCSFSGCKKAFKRLDALKNHVRIHTKEMPYPCTFPDCDKRFPTKASLRYHVLKHDNFKGYICTYPGCNKSFLTAFQLKQHEKSTYAHSKLNASPKDTDTVSTKSSEVEENPHPYKRIAQLIEGLLEKSNEKLPVEGFLDAFEAKMQNMLVENEMLKQRVEICERVFSSYVEKHHQFSNQPSN